MIDEQDLNSISLNQMNPNYFVTGGSDAIVRVWDRRTNSSNGGLCTSVKRFCPSRIAVKAKPFFDNFHITGNTTRSYLGLSIGEIDKSSLFYFSHLYLYNVSMSISI